jgi:hypothetical protein
MPAKGREKNEREPRSKRNPSPGLASPGPSPQEKRADQRNEGRLAKANQVDADILGKYLPSSAKLFLPTPVPGPDDHFTKNPEFLDRLRTVTSAPAPTPASPSVKFDTSSHAMKHNSRLLKESDYNLEKLFLANSGTTLDYGSEFRPINQLRQVMGGHPQFEELVTVLTHGMDYRFHRELDEANRLEELVGMLERGNHKSSEAEPEQVNRLLAKDVTHGFSLPILPETVPLLVDALVQPFGLAQQFTLNESGERIVKWRLTQDLSFSLTDDERSVNARIDMDLYNEMIYGWCLSRLIHYIVALRMKYPTSKIFIAKYDYSDAYRRVNHSAKAAVQSIAVFDGVAYVALRLTFGGSPNPPTWCLFSEMVTDLANEITSCAEWDPTTLRSPTQTVTPIPREVAEGEPFAPGLQTAVEVPVLSTSKTDGFIDDLIQVFLDTPENRERGAHCVPLAVHATSRPHAGDEEPIPRRSLLGEAKLLAEGTPAELQIVLGWLVATRSLLVSLPDDKFESWVTDLQAMIDSKRTTYGDLDSMVGRLNHAAFLIPLARHFLNRLRNRIQRSQPQKQEITLSREEISDMILWVTFLETANKGISMNRLTIRQPTRICLSDSCPFGVAGYSIGGRAWRIRIPASSPLYGDGRFNNVFEFLGSAVTVWLEVLDCPESSECILALGDSTSALGWIHRSGRVKDDSMSYCAIQAIARHLATLLLHSNHCLATQHLKGDYNVVADLLSYSGTVRGKPHPLASDHPPDDILTQRFHSHLASQIPANFKILPLPSAILSWATQVLQIAESSLIRARRKEMKPKTGSGDVGSTSAAKEGCRLTPSSLLYPAGDKNFSSGHSWDSTATQTGIKTANLPATVRDQWYRALCAVPQAVWLRRCGTITNKVPFTSRAAQTCALHCGLCSVPLKIPTPPLSGKRPSLQSSCAACLMQQALALPPLPSSTPLQPPPPILPSGVSSSQSGPASTLRRNSQAKRRLST